MALSDVIISNLIEFYSREGIREMWKQSAAALMSRSTSKLHINQRSRDGASSTAIVLADRDEMAAFCEACQAAIARIDGVTTTSPNNLATAPNFGGGMVKV